MIFNGSKLNPFSTAFFGKLRELSNMVDLVADSLNSMESNSRAWGIPIVFRVSDNTINASRPIWTYGLTQVQPKSSAGSLTDYEDMSGGVVITCSAGVGAVNRLELGNTATTAYGNTVAWSGSAWVFASPFAGTSFAAVPNNTVVDGWCVVRPDGTIRWEFSAPNKIAPGCS